MTIAGVLLAAGQSRRMGQPKALLDFGGRPLWTYAAAALLEAGWAGADLEPLLVVVPPTEVGAQISAALPQFRAVQNPDPARGMASSFRAAVAALPKGCTGALFLLADMPFVTSQTVQQVAQAFRDSGAPLVLTRYGTGPEAVTAPPHLFRADLFDELQSLPDADTGPRQVLRAYAAQTVFVPRPATELLDLDTPEAVTKAQQLLA